MKGVSSRMEHLHSYWGRGGLMVRSRFQGGRAGDSKPDSTEDLQCMRACCTLNQTQWVKCPSLVWCTSLESGCQHMCRRRHLTAVQKYEVSPKNNPRFASRRDVNITQLKPLHYYHDLSAYVI
ncbi:hypothetical protein AVEN_25649-1 [Araneus ventricosus]|uniref:Uncharacterized protein n=1 Tax=Araneus ventricosus TaxID=182803 RepID=A0A4Y2BN48_ARAVE|nr:hypothetical protein AVEN_25649-1 [Araneus ventricosus]